MIFSYIRLIIEQSIQKNTKYKLAQIIKSYPVTGCQSQDYTAKP